MAGHAPGVQELGVPRSMIGLFRRSPAPQDSSSFFMLGRDLQNGLSLAIGDACYDGRHLTWQTLPANTKRTPIRTVSETNPAEGCSLLRRRSFRFSRLRCAPLFVYIENKKGGEYMKIKVHVRAGKVRL